MMRGVYKDNERYLKTYWCKWGGKYYYAGDNASRDEDGYIYVSGRADEVLKVSGHRIGTAEIEAAIMEDQRVAETAVIGIDDKVKGTSVLAYVVIKGQYLNDTNISKLEKELKLSVQNNLGSYARPEHIVFVPQVPKNRSGKVLRRILRCIFENKEHGNTETLVNPSSIEEVTEAVRQYKEKLDSNSFLKSRFFSPIVSRVKLSSDDIIKKVQPILSDHLVKNSYNRIYPLVTFIDFFESRKKTNVNISPLEALKEFDLKPIMESNRNSGPCFVLANVFHKALPGYLKPYLISSKMSEQFHQRGYHEYSHVAIIIHYEDPDNKNDKGVILIDPNFDIPVPLVFNDKNQDVSINMGEKRGIWNFSYNGSTIVCKSSKSKNEKELQDEAKGSPTIYYVNFSVTNPYLFAFKPMLAADTSPSIVSRDKNGRHIAHLKLNLKKRTIIRSIDGRYLPIVTFEDFLKKPYLEASFCNKLRLPQSELIIAVQKVIEHADMLRELRNSFLQ